MQMKLGADFHPEDLSDNKIKIVVERVFERFRHYKYMGFTRREATITSVLSDMPRGNTNVTSDQTAQIAIYNVDSAAFMQSFCDEVEEAVNRLPSVEKILIEERYLSKDSDYITDQTVYNHKFDEKIGHAISRDTYIKIRKNAFKRIYHKSNWTKWLEHR